MAKVAAEGKLLHNGWFLPEPWEEYNSEMYDDTVYYNDDTGEVEADIVKTGAWRVECTEKSREEDEQVQPEEQKIAEEHQTRESLRLQIEALEAERSRRQQEVAATQKLEAEQAKLEEDHQLRLQNEALEADRLRNEQDIMASRIDVVAMQKLEVQQSKLEEEQPKQAAAEQQPAGDNQSQELRLQNESLEADRLQKEQQITATHKLEAEKNEPEKEQPKHASVEHQPAENNETREVLRQQIKASEPERLQKEQNITANQQLGADREELEKEEQRRQAIAEQQAAEEHRTREQLRKQIASLEAARHRKQKEIALNLAAERAKLANKEEEEQRKLAVAEEILVLQAQLRTAEERQHRLALERKADMQSMSAWRTLGYHEKDEERARRAQEAWENEKEASKLRLRQAQEHELLAWQRVEMDKQRVLEEARLKALKPQQGAIWRCMECDFDNPLSKTICYFCDTQRDRGLVATAGLGTDKIDSN